MNRRTAIYYRQYQSSTGTEQELRDHLTQTVEDRGDVLAGTYIDDGHLTGKGKYSGWRALLNDLGTIDQIVLADPGDLPGRTVGDLLNILAILTTHGVAMVLPDQAIDTSTGPAAILDLIRSYRRAKLSQAIKAGQTRTTKRIGRPPIPEGVRRRIAVDLAEGAGTRPTARKFGISAASVANIRQTMMAPLGEAA